MPTQCKVIFGDPIDLCAFAPGPERDPKFYGRVAHHCQGELQAVLDREAANRPLARLARRVRDVQKARPSDDPPFRFDLVKYLRRAQAVARQRWS
jgi:hypothetical protein